MDKEESTNGLAAMSFENHPEGHKKSKSVCTRCCQCWAVLTTILTLTSAGLAAYLAWLKITSSDKTITTESLMNKYPGYFRSVEEQLDLESRLRSIGLQPVRNYTVVPYYCDSDCQTQPWYNNTKNAGRKKRQANSGGNTLFHGCCQSSTSYTSPNTLTNIFSVEKTLLHLGTASRQFFKVSDCVQAVGCTGCQCIHEEEINTAVTFKLDIDQSTADLDDLEIDLFFIQGCCKCVNDGS